MISEPLNKCMAKISCARDASCIVIVLVGLFLFRVPEIVYQPSMLGIEQAGIAETIDFILNHFTADLQAALVQVRPIDCTTLCLRHLFAFKFLSR